MPERHSVVRIGGHARRQCNWCSCQMDAPSNGFVWGLFIGINKPRQTMRIGKPDSKPLAKILIIHNVRRIQRPYFKALFLVLESER